MEPIQVLLKHKVFVLLESILIFIVIIQHIQTYQLIRLIYLISIITLATYKMEFDFYEKQLKRDKIKLYSVEVKDKQSFIQQILMFYCCFTGFYTSYTNANIY